MIFFRKKCKECGNKLHPPLGCNFCSAMKEVSVLYDELKKLYTLYHRMGGFRITGEIDKNELIAIDRNEMDLKVRKC